MFVVNNIFNISFVIVIERVIINLLWIDFIIFFEWYN